MEVFSVCWGKLKKGIKSVTTSPDDLVVIFWLNLIEPFSN